MRRRGKSVPQDIAVRSVVTKWKLPDGFLDEGDNLFLFRWSDP